MQPEATRRLPRRYRHLRCQTNRTCVARGSERSAKPARSFPVVDAMRGAAYRPGPSGDVWAVCRTRIMQGGSERSLWQIQRTWQPGPCTANPVSASSVHSIAQARRYAHTARPVLGARPRRSQQAPRSSTGRPRLHGCGPVRDSGECRGCFAQETRRVSLGPAFRESTPGPACDPHEVPTGAFLGVTDMTALGAATETPPRRSGSDRLTHARERRMALHGGGRHADPLSP